jgi:hypothetical protein
MSSFTKLVCFEIKFPTKEDMNKERERFHLEMGLAAGIPKDIMDNQLGVIGRTVWSHVYWWMKQNTTVALEDNK